MSVIATVLFQRLETDMLRPSKYLLVQSQQQDNRKRSELCAKLIIKRVDSRSYVFIVNFE